MLKRIKSLEKSQAIYGILQLITKKKITKYDDYFEYLEEFENKKMINILKCKSVSELEQFEHSFGYYKIGQLYLTGFTVDKNEDQSIEYFKKSAEMGNMQAFDMLGLLYMKIDIIQSIDYFLKGLELGSSVSAYGLGDIYYFDEYKQKDIEKAIEYYKQTTDETGLNTLAVIYEKRGDIKSALKYFHLSAEKGSSIGQNNLGSFYEFGTYVQEDKQKALELYKSSAMQNNPNGVKNYIGLSTELDPLFQINNIIFRE
jgi:TPR repeat protein